MLKDLKRISDRDELVEVDELKRAAGVILERQFLYADSDRDRKVYFMLATQGDYYRNLFDALNHEFVYDQEIGMIGVIPRSRTTSLRLKKDEALLLLTLRYIYEESLENFTHQHGCALTNSEKLLAKYEVSTGLDRRPQLTELRRILTMFKSMGIIDDIQDDDRIIDFRIRPAIQFVLNESWLKTLELHAGVSVEEFPDADDELEMVAETVEEEVFDETAD